ncbi:MAG: DNA recombination protein RmuC [Alphaproteobacteria bacterium]|nr:DNA recombination protein RmuC [Alphaproteobacteria bacterium]
MDPGLVYALIALAAAAVAAGLAAAMLRQMRRLRDDSASFGRTVDSVLRGQGELTGRLDQLAADGAARGATLGNSLREGLEQSSARTAESLGELRERLKVIDEAQKNITELSGQVVGLQDILSNKQARGAFGNVQLRDLVQSALPPSAFQFEATLSNGRRADCLIKLPMPPGPIAVDAKFPRESFEALRAAPDEPRRNQAASAFRRDILKHVRDIAERYIVSGETAESALMFLPSEAIYAELHANFTELVQQSYRARVWIVSPTTLMATLNTVRAVLQDANMRKQAEVIQGEVHKMLEDVDRLGERAEKLRRHFRQAGEDVDQILISTDKIDRRGRAIVDIGLGEGADEAIEGTQATLRMPITESR